MEKRIKRIEMKWQGRNSASLPHLTVVIPRILRPEKTETDLINAIARHLSETKAFFIQTEGIGQFNKKRVIYIKISNTPELIQCHRIVNDAVAGVLEPKEEKRPYRPHITLAKGLPTDKGKKAWKELSHLKRIDTFCCQRIQLLRMKQDENVWSVIKVFCLI